MACEKDWGDSFAEIPNYAKKLSALIRKTVGEISSASVLDLNADTGRLAFELAPYYKSVMALDFTARMLRMGNQLQEQGGMRYTMKDENDLVLYREVLLKDLGLGVGMNKINFMQSDINNLKPIYTGYDIVVISDILQEVARPRKFLASMSDRINKNGYLIIASDYNWNLDITPHKYWLGGYKKDGEPVTALDALKKSLFEHFNAVGDPQDLEIISPKSSRISEKRLLQVTFWRKK